MSTLPPLPLSSQGRAACLGVTCQKSTEPRPPHWRSVCYIAGIVLLPVSPLHSRRSGEEALRDDTGPPSRLADMKTRSRRGMSCQRGRKNSPRLHGRLPPRPPELSKQRAEWAAFKLMGMAGGEGSREKARHSVKARPAGSGWHPSTPGTEKQGPEDRQPCPGRGHSTASGWSPSWVSSPHTHRGQVVSQPGPPAAPVWPQLLQGPHGSHLGLDLGHV